MFRPNVREYSRQSWILDSTPWIQILGTEFQYLSVELGIWITIDNAVLYSSSCIPDSKVPIPQAKISRIHLHGAKCYEEDLLFQDPRLLTVLLEDWMK